MVLGSAEHRLVVFDGEPTRAVCSVEQYCECRRSQLDATKIVTAPGGTDGERRRAEQNPSAFEYSDAAVGARASQPTILDYLK